MNFGYPLIALFLCVATARAENWPSWRGGPSGLGVSEDTSLPLPLAWSKEKNIRWRVALPERGNSTPIVWGNRILVTQAITAENWRGLLCFDRTDGKLLWKNGLVYNQEERSHKDNPYGSASPATNGEIVVAAFGSAGVAAYDFEGKEIWKRDFGPIDHIWGSSTSPVILGNLVFHYHGPADDATFLTALDLKTGSTVWKWDEPKWQPGKRTDGFANSEDKGVIGSWSTPIVVNSSGKDILVMSFPMEMKAFDPSTGNILWTVEGLNPLVYTSPVASGDVIVAMGGYFGNSVGATHDGKLLWQEVRHFGGIGTGVVKDGFLFAQDAGGIVQCVDLATGKTQWKDRLPGAGKSWGSYLLSGDLIYTLSQAGDTVVFKASPEKFEVVAQSDIGEHTNSSLVASKGEIFIRTFDALWCISPSK